MPLELEKERICWKECAGKQRTQVLLEGDMIVPDSRPDLSEIIRAEGRVKLREKKMGEERIGFSGEAVILVLYRARDGEKPLYSLRFSLHMEDLIHMEGLEKDMEVSLSGELLHLDCRIINDRKLGVRAVVQMEAEAERERELEVVTGAEGEGIQCLYGTLCTEEKTVSLTDRFSVREETDLPPSKGEIGEVLWEKVRLSEQEIRPMEGRAMVRGSLKVSLLYTDRENGSLQSYTEKIPFSGYLEHTDIRPKTELFGRLNISEASLSPTADEDGEVRRLNVDVTVGAELFGRERTEKKLLLDAYTAQGKTVLKRETLTCPVTEAGGENRFSLKERVTAEQGEPPLLLAEQVFGEVKLEGLRAVKDGVEAEGVLMAEVLYSSEDDREPVSVLKRGIPFTQTVEWKGIRPDTELTGEVCLEELDFQSLTDREGELRGTLTLHVLAKSAETAEAVTDIVLEEETEALPRAGAVICVVQEGDSLWSIAKRYHTTVEDILAVNEIADPDAVHMGQKLLIVKTAH